MKAYWALEVHLHSFLNFALDGGGQFHPQLLYSQGTSPHYSLKMKAGYVPDMVCIFWRRRKILRNQVFWVVMFCSNAADSCHSKGTYHLHLLKES